MRLECFEVLTEHHRPNGLFAMPGDSETIYRCPKCKAVLSAGQLVCSCGTPLDWSRTRAMKNRRKHP